jgi:uncharacterized protein (DUF58 family)
VNVNFARLNHILIPSTKERRDRLRNGWFGRALRPLGLLYESLSDEGRLLALAQVGVAVFGIDVQATQVYVLWAALVGLLVGSVAVCLAYRMPAVSLAVSAPPRISVGAEVVFTLTARNDGPRDHFALRFRGPFLPWDGRWTSAMPRVAVLRAGDTARVEARARFAARGEHHLDAFHAAALVPLGLAMGPSLATTGIRFLVVPKLANVAQVTTALARRHQPGGVALASKTGESMDLLGVRPYRPGDPVRHLHARTWARVGTPAVREYQEEYFSRIGVVVDTAIAEERRLEAAVSLAAGVVACLSRGEALIDLLVAGDVVHNLTIGRHLGFLDQALDVLATVEAAPKRVAPEKLLARLAPHLTRLSCVVVVAPAWDGGELARRIQGFGVACKTLVLVGPSGRGRTATAAAAPLDRDALQVPVEAIERGQALAL